jgi:fibronectin-binding autotransporter adhesin
MVVDGPGAQLVVGGNSYIGRSGTGTLTVENGGVVSVGLMTVAANAGSAGTINIIGAGSRLTNSGSGLQNTIGFRELGTLNIVDGGTMASTGASVSVGFASGTVRGEGVVDISGAGSRWDVTGALDAYNGAITLADGGILTAASARLGLGSGTAMDLLVSGAGSRFETSGALTLATNAAGAGAITIADGGVVKIGDGTLAMGPGNAVLNIGGAEGAMAAAAGSLEAPAVTMATSSNRINFNHDDAAYSFAAAIAGAGVIHHLGSGNTVLTGANSYTGGTMVNVGGLYIDGDQSGATGPTLVAPLGTLGGTGTIGGDVLVVGGTLDPGALGSAPGTLTINGTLSLFPGATLNVDFGQADVAGGALNDLINVGGDLVLEGTLNVRTAAGGSFDPGIYRVINYDGVLTGGGLTIGTIPSPDFYVQTSVARQVNLVNTAGLQFRYWDGPTSKNDGVIDGGNGLWQRSDGNDNWVDDGSIPNAPFADDAFAVFMGAAGEVTVDGSLGDVTAGGMQFLTDGYVLGGDALTLVGTQAVIRTGDGTAAGAGVTATIDAELTGAAQLVKSDLGTLILTGPNSHMGGTAVHGGILQVAMDSSLGDAAGSLGFDGGTLHATATITTDRAVALAGDGGLLTDSGTTLALTGTISGAGGLVKDGAGTLELTGDNSYAGQTRVHAGLLVVNGDQSAASGLTDIGAGATLAGRGTLGGDVTIADGGILAPGTSPGTMTIAGHLSLSAGSILDFEFGEAGVAGGTLNDLINVGGDLVLDGTLNVSVSAGGAFGAGIYRVFNYGGALTDNGLSLGLMPAGSMATVQTSIAGQVNLVNTDGLMLNFWDGSAGPKFDNVVNGGDGIWQNSLGNDNWTDASGGVNAGYADGGVAIFAGAGGQVMVDNSLGAVEAAGLQFAADGYVIGGETLTLTGPLAAIRVGDGSAAGADFTATIASEVTGAVQLVKTDAGTLILSGANSYSGGTAIEGGTLAIAADSNLGAAAGGVTLAGGTLRTMADGTSDRAIGLTGTGTVLTDAATTFTLHGALSGTGALTKEGAGTLVLTGNNGGYGAATRVAGGTLAVDGTLGGIVTVAQAGRLEGTGQVGGIVNSGRVAPGRDGMGTLTVAGDYAGHGGTLAIETVLGDDSSQTSRLVVHGATSGTTQVSVANRGGLGAATVEGIKIIDVAGVSDGVFTLNGDYLFQGEQAVIAGAYGYRLYQGGVASPTDGDWYLRSGLLDPVDPGEPGGPDEPGMPNLPLYQPGVPVYEVYGANLLALNSLPTLQQRVGNRSWAAGANPEGGGIWGRMEGTRDRARAALSTSGAHQTINSWKLHLGADQLLKATDKGERLVAGVTAYYGQASSHVRSLFGNGALKTDGYGLGATLSWYGLAGFYLDGQAQFSWYDSKLDSDVLGRLVNGNGGSGEAFSVEAGKRTSISGTLSLTPQLQMAYANVRFDRFADPADALVASGKGDSLTTRGGLSLDHQSSWEGGQSHLYGIVNLNYEWLDGTRTMVAGTPLDHANERLWGELGLGASISWTKGLTLYGEVSGNSALRDFGDSYTLKANAGIRLAF